MNKSEERSLPPLFWLFGFVLILLLAFGLRLCAARWGIPFVLPEEELRTLAQYGNVDGFLPFLVWQAGIFDTLLQPSTVAISVFTGRLLSVFAGVLVVVISYRLTRQRGLSQRAALSVATLLAVFADAVVYAGRFHTATWATLFVLIALLCAGYAYQRRSVQWSLAHLIWALGTLGVSTARRFSYLTLAIGLIWLVVSGWWLFRLGMPDTRQLLVTWLRDNLSAPEVIIWSNPASAILHQNPGGLPGEPYWIVWEPNQELYGRPIQTWREAGVQYFLTIDLPQAVDTDIFRGVVYETPIDHLGVGPRWQVWRTYSPQAKWRESSQLNIKDHAGRKYLSCSPSPHQKNVSPTVCAQAAIN